MLEKLENQGSAPKGLCSDSELHGDQGRIRAEMVESSNGRLLQERKMTIPEAAQAMGIGTTSLRRIIKDGRLPVLNILHKVLILESDVEAFLQGARVIVKQTKNTSNRLPPLPKCVTESEHLT